MRAIDPHTNKVIEEHKPLPEKTIQQKIELSYQSFLKHSKTDLETRKKKILRIAEILEERAEKYGSYITREMGKPITESIAEVKKAAKNFRFVYDNLESFLQSDYVKTDFKEARVDYQPIGPIYFITPYNFPFWLSLKGAGPALAMGNTILLKTASSCPRSGLCVEEAIRDAGFDNNEFQHLFATQEQSEFVISNPLIRGVSFTGSTKGGAEIAALAGKYTKKSILELGGSDPCVLMPDADIETAVKVVYNSRMRNDGQVCSCIKRLIVHEGVYDEFRDKLIERLKKVKIGDPMKKETEAGPIGVKRIYDRLLQEIEEGKKQGAKILYGGCRPEGEELAKGNYILPTVLECDEKNILWNEEVFGPVFPLIKYNDLNEALRMANQTNYGLGAVVIGKNTKQADNFAKDIMTGSVGINETVQTDPRLPSGGVKDSGYGRECGVIGAREFVNCKSVMIR